MRTRTLTFVHPLSVAVHIVPTLAGPGPSGVSSAISATLENNLNAYYSRVSSRVAVRRPVNPKPVWTRTCQSFRNFVSETSISVYMDFPMHLEHLIPSFSPLPSRVLPYTLVFDPCSVRSVSYELLFDRIFLLTSHLFLSSLESMELCAKV